MNKSTLLASATTLLVATGFIASPAAAQTPTAPCSLQTLQ